MEIISNPAREAAADYLGNILLQAFEAVDLEEIQEAFGVELNEAMAILYEMGTASAAIYWESDECSCTDEDDDLHDFVVGDVDPTQFYGDDYDCCPSSDGLYRCTREQGHPGQHVAGDGYEVCAVWP